MTHFTRLGLETLIGSICGINPDSVSVVNPKPYLWMVSIYMNDNFDASTFKFLSESIIDGLKCFDNLSTTDLTLSFYNLIKVLTYVVRLRDGKVKFEHFEF